MHKMLQFLNPKKIMQEINKNFRIHTLCTNVASLVGHILLQKMMQAMLTAFITMNTSNSGIPSTKANPISRTFPPLFTIKISEEEKIVEDLQEIESMQLIVQVIMVIVCI